MRFCERDWGTGTKLSNALSPYLECLVGIPKASHTDYVPFSLFFSLLFFSPAAFEGYLNWQILV